jgi:serine/threonine protein kinase
LYDKLRLPKNISQEVRSLIIGLLNRNPLKRLGSSPGAQGAQEIMNHSFFKDINWQNLYNKLQTGNGFWPEKP